MKLAELLEKTEYEVRQGSTDQEVKGLAYDSRKVSGICVCVHFGEYAGWA